MYRVLVNIFVELFVKKKHRAKVRYAMRGFFDRILVIKKAKNVGKNFECAQGSIVNKRTTIGNDVKINGIKVLGDGDVIIGNNVIIGEGCLICSDNHNYNGKYLPFDETLIRKTVEIGDYVWIGVRCTILPGTKIGEGAIIQAGAVVHGEIPSCSIVGGNPAKIFKHRDIEHYKKVKAEMERKNANI